MENIRLIENFFDNNLEGEKLVAFQKKFENDNDFKNQVELHKDINTSILEDDIYSFRIQLADLIQKNKTNRRPIHFLFPVAALIIGGLALLHFYNETNFNDVFSTYYRPYEADLIVRSAGNSLTNLNNTYLLYEKGEYQEAFDKLQEYSLEEPENYKSAFFLGLSAIEIGKYQIAENSFIRIIDGIGKSSYKVHAKWYLSLLYLKQNLPEKAKPYLLSLSHEYYYAKKAKKILKKLD
jgi:hypothetical protein